MHYDHNQSTIIQCSEIKYYCEFITAMNIIQQIENPKPKQHKHQ